MFSWPPWPPPGQLLPASHIHRRWRGAIQIYSIQYDPMIASYLQMAAIGPPLADISVIHSLFVQTSDVPALEHPSPVGFMKGSPGVSQQICQDVPLPLIPKPGQEPCTPEASEEEWQSQNLNVPVSLVQS